MTKKIIAYTLHQAAEAIQVSYPTIRKMLREPGFPFSATGGDIGFRVKLSANGLTLVRKMLDAVTVARNAGLVLLAKGSRFWICCPLHGEKRLPCDSSLMASFTASVAARTAMRPTCTRLCMAYRWRRHYGSAKEIASLIQRAGKLKISAKGWSVGFRNNEALLAMKRTQC